MYVSRYPRHSISDCVHAVIVAGPMKEELNMEGIKHITTVCDPILLIIKSAIPCK